MAMNDAVDWALDLGGGTRVALIQAGTFRSDAGGAVRAGAADPLGPTDERRDRSRIRLEQALNCLLVETPAGRVLVETGIGERLVTEGPRDAPGSRAIPDRAGAARGGRSTRSRRRRGNEPSALRSCGRPAPRGSGRGPSRGPRSSRSAPSGQIGVDDNSRIVASYDQPELRAGAGLGRRRRSRR